MRHGEGKDEARELYVHQQMTFDEIAKRIGRSDRTVRDWATEDNWKQERQDFLKTRISVHEKLHKLVEQLTDRMIDDCTTGATLSPQSMHALTNLVTAMNNLYKYEDKKQADIETPDKSAVTPEQIAERVREIMGA
ncbi:MAG TPA: phage terminase small subunit-related protein [Chitinispirillaceae bacterium]|nr:phage terminase small subunit-related protein [Chitinispirillaceae bacterium]